MKDIHISSMSSDYVVTYHIRLFRNSTSVHVCFCRRLLRITLQAPPVRQKKNSTSPSMKI